MMANGCAEDVVRKNSRQALIDGKYGISAQESR